MTRKFVYDPHVERVRMVAGSRGSQQTMRRSSPLRWLLVALVITASALAFDAAHAVGQARSHAMSAR